MCIRDSSWGGETESILSVVILNEHKHFKLQVGDFLSETDYLKVSEALQTLSRSMGAPGFINYQAGLNAVDTLIAEYEGVGPSSITCSLCKAAEAAAPGAKDSCEYCLWNVFENTHCCAWLNKQPGRPTQACDWGAVHENPLLYGGIIEERLKMLRRWRQALLVGEISLDIRGEERYED